LRVRLDVLVECRKPPAAAIVAAARERGVPLMTTTLILTFAVPYAVATYGAVSYRLRASPERKTEDRH
jgi:hypothetical protein